MGSCADPHADLRPAVARACPRRWISCVSANRARRQLARAAANRARTVAAVSSGGAGAGRVRLDRDEHAEFGIERLYLVSRGRRLPIGGFLGPDEKASFAHALSAALGEAKRGPTRTVFG